MDETLTGAMPALERSDVANNAQLVCVMGPAMGRVYNLGPRDTVIGRSSDADITIAGDDVSRRHAHIWSEDGTFFVEDLGSRNGTKVNGVAIARHPLAVGDRLEIGASTILSFSLRDELAVRVERIQRLEVMSELTAGLTHDFRNLLTVVAGNAGLVEHMVGERYAADHELAEGVQDLSRAVNAALTLMHRLFEFVRRDVAVDRASAFALRAVVDEVLTLLRHGLPPNIDVLVDVDERIQVFGNRGEMHQIISNLCLNARDAMPEGGWLEIRATFRSLSRREALSLQLDCEGDFVELRVIDTGGGMDAATLARAFEPFFTTKAPGSGSGLGLASVYGNVRNRGGSVLAESAPDRGTTFRLFLPAPPTDVARRQSPTIPATPL